MTPPLTVIVPHKLGKAEARHRIETGLDHMRGNLAAFVAIEQETWEADTVRFQMRGFGQSAAGTIEVLDDALRIEVTLPWLLAKVSGALLPALRSEATKLLTRR